MERGSRARRCESDNCRCRCSRRSNELTTNAVPLAFGCPLLIGAWQRRSEGRAAGLRPRTVGDCRQDHADLDAAGREPERGWAHRAGCAVKLGGAASTACSCWTSASMRSFCVLRRGRVGQSVLRDAPRHVLTAGFLHGSRSRRFRTPFFYCARRNEGDTSVF